ncbi:hypothetical protein JWG42_05690 [Desulfoprunum benzoelyticum]|uniref:YkgJ family cysteine cluster protein n=1 Tax=Desulfoprunum benzoelyticum TaxID=1506996 RepID=A0A840UNZ2_9BACT|nr:hypothetical protein [Desulfoprunum benzoelyticum]MBB5347482.1 hypothetical protein [Desulfoprunum benzoelyticum]MBM9529640.1 hypothetical protein [Desulfoprunum benzoelyticum]
MNELPLPEPLVQRLKNIYRALEEDYDEVARQLQFSCSGCPDNCCDSYFLHYTYVEWAYLWQGLRELPPVRQKNILDRAGEVVRVCREELAHGRRPVVMCPLNENGLCVLYPYRLLVCRTHGVPAVMTLPDGRRLSFPGCYRCQEVVRGRENDAGVPFVDRTKLLQLLVMLESELLQGLHSPRPRIRMTIAEMLVKGPPTLT